MNAVLRFLIALILSPAVPAIVIVTAALPSPGFVLPLAKTLLVYGYLATLLVAAPTLLVFRRQFSRSPVMVIPLAGIIGALIAAMPFLAAISSRALKWTDWTSFLALVPVSVIGAMFGVLAGVTFFLIGGPSLSRWNADRAL